jgi:hypothetical protein
MAEMNSFLAKRYQEAYEGYPIEHGVIGLVKTTIDQFAEGRPGHLRTDAKYFLLLNFAEMIIKPHAEYLGEGLSEAVHKALNLILTQLSAMPSPVSGHAVMKVIDSNWPQLAETFWWA